MTFRWLSAESRNDLVWLWHTIFDGTWACRCWHSVWTKDLRDGARAHRQTECGNCSFCLLPIDVLIARGDLQITQGEPCRITLE